MSVVENGVGEVRPYGPHAVLVDVVDAATGAGLARWARSGGLSVSEAVPGAGTVLLDGVESVEAARAALARWRPVPAEEVAGFVEVPVTYDGADLEQVARLWGVSPREVVERHTGVEFTSAFCGFAPGFAYLVGLPQQWSVPRLASPRRRVPPGSVALADSWCGVYPGASPGGWLLLGSTDLQVWDPSREDPCVLGPGTRVRFVVR